MTYDLYYHDDFDGRASAAILLNFFRSRGDAVGRYVPLNFDRKKEWPRFQFGRNPAALVDFIYHPKAALWFDHHPTTFVLPAWEKKFKSSPRRRWNSAYASCCHLVLDSLVKDFGFKPPAHLKELAKWLDVVDGANFKSPRQTVLLKESALQIDAFIDARTKKKESLSWLVELLSKYSLREIAKNARVKRTVMSIKKEIARAKAFYNRHMEIAGNTVVVDTSLGNVKEIRFYPFDKYPDTTYGITLKKGSSVFHITAGVNPWRRKFGKVHMGNLVRQFGGGGHRYVGGLEVKTHKEAGLVIQKILNTLNKK